MKIVAHSYICSKGAYLNGQLVCAAGDHAEKDILKGYYTALSIDYPKFHKMDSLSKSAIIGDYLLQETYKMIPDFGDSLQLIFANKNASTLTDLNYIHSYSEGKSPSPSLFVYTLPNIVTGELAIKNKWYGENSFFILPHFDEEFFEEQLQFSFLRGNEYCLIGWVEFNEIGEQECLLFLVQNSEQKEIKSKLINIYNTYKNE